jgi:hypothetical protein
MSLNSSSRQAWNRGGKLSIETACYTVLHLIHYSTDQLCNESGMVVNSYPD